MKNKRIAWNKGRKMPQITGVKNSRYNSFEKKCLECGTDFMVNNYRKDIAKYCSHDCAQRARLCPEEEVDYHALHKWVSFHLGSPKKCSKCGFVSGNSRQFHWASINHLYKRDISNWIRLCVSCHMKFDNRNKTYLGIA